MEIDLFTFIAQILNFLILMAILRKFLFGRIVKAMKEREEKVARDLALTEKNLLEAHEQQEASKILRLKSEKEHNERVKQLEQELAQVREDRMEQIQQYLDKERERWLSELELERRDMTIDIARRSTEIMFLALKKGLTELANEDLEKKIVHIFLNKIQESDLSWIQEAEKITITTGFALSSELRSDITRFVAETGNANCLIAFVQNSDELCGIDLSVPGKRIQWSLCNFFDQLETSLLFPEGLPI